MGEPPVAVGGWGRGSKTHAGVTADKSHSIPSTPLSLSSTHTQTHTHTHTHTHHLSLQEGYTPTPTCSYLCLALQLTTSTMELEQLLQEEPTMISRSTPSVTPLRVTLCWEGRTSCCWKCTVLQCGMNV